ncbi:flavin monoamine oxidase family protein [Glaciecola sp. 1036]|uniref:flavin monoamine oxidase family protein n=1 Tax=Alteromonadaceae TaxID=72275 RepID=UPI003D02F4FC
MKKLTRRQFLQKAAIAGGSLAVYNSCLALDLLDTHVRPKHFQLSPSNKQSKIVILGGGVAGLATAYELERAGYECIILEASHRVGGRNLTLRHGDLIDELGRPNYCQFEDKPNLYFNAGPARIPGHHQRTLYYCKELKIPLQVKANQNRLAYFHEDASFNGQPKRQVEYITDARGFLAELVFKAINKNVFEAELTKEDIEKLRHFAGFYGDLSKDGAYKGSHRAGSQSDRMLTHGDHNIPQKLEAFLNSNFWQDAMNHTEFYDWIEPLMEPKGGMDQIVKGFANAIKSPILTKAQVQKIQLTNNGVVVHYQHKGHIHKINADYCFNNIPAPILAGIDNNFSEHYMQALAAIKRKDLFKIGFQMRERFWEKEGIYGGISYTSQKNAQIWYPSHDINSEKGVVLGAYVWNPQDCEFFANLSLKERLAYAANCGDKVHKEYSSHIEQGVSIAWSRMNHLMGCGNAFEEHDYEKYFHTVQTPEGNHVMIGDQISYHPGWQEGAFASVEVALMSFDKKMQVGG